MTTNPGWFDAFRDNGGPVLYSSQNRVPAVQDVRNTFIYITFSTLFIAFLIILPGIRKEVSNPPVAGQPVKKPRGMLGDE